MHTEAHPLAGQTVILPNDLKTLPPVPAGSEFHIEDWWDHLTGGSWMFADGNPACLIYAMRSAGAGLPTDNEVVYGKVDGLGHLVHVSELP